MIPKWDFLARKKDKKGETENHSPKKGVKMAQNLERRSEVYTKALDVFIQRGYSGTSIAMIAKALGMSKANLYHYCSSKEDLFFRVHLEYLEKHIIPLIAEAEQVPDPEGRIAFVLKRLTLLNATDKASRVLIPDIINLNRSHHNEIIFIWRRFYDILSNAIKELQQSGKAAKGREAFQALLGFGMVNWIAFWFDYGRQVNVEELADTLVGLFLNGLLKPAPEKQ
jgi:AcrR family transcriptional regulator